MTDVAASLAGADPLRDYDQDAYFCEMFGLAAGNRDPEFTRLLRHRLSELGLDELQARAGDAELELYNFGITFTVYTQKEAIDRILPFDVIPRVISAADWDTIERGVEQRVAAINLFLQDVYHEQKVFADGVVPTELVLGNKNYRPEMRDLDLKFGTYVHINGTDLVRGDDGDLRVLEDNGRTPSGVSYVVENRHLMRTFPDLMTNIGIRPVSNYGAKLHDALLAVAPEGILDPQVVLLSPGTFNSAYFEHIFLAREMGVPLVEGGDLVVEENDRVYMRTISGLRPVHVIYRRINDDFLDPEAFEPTSMLGVPGLMRAYRKGNVALANAIGTGVADDKAVYAYMPRIIQYYLDQDPILPNVETQICREDEGLQYTLDNLDKLVVKPVGEAGGYGITVGPRASKAELEDCRAQLVDDPANYISQPMINLSVSPTLTDEGIQPRHVDLRPFAVTGSSTWLLPGGLSRVALTKGSLIVNSSQGGGSKDTWVLE